MKLSLPLNGKKLVQYFFMVPRAHFLILLQLSDVWMFCSFIQWRSFHFKCLQLLDFDSLDFNVRRYCGAMRWFDLTIVCFKS